MNTTPETPSNSGSKATELQQGLLDALATADSDATQTMQNLKLLQLARLSQLARTAAALKKQYGPNDENVVAAEAAVMASNARVARIALVHQQLDTVAPPVSPSGWALHGRVFNSTLQPVSQLTVFLVDTEKAYRGQYGFAYTDDSGYFLINYPGGDKAGKSSPQNKHQSAPELYIQIASKGGKPLFLSTAVFQPADGSTTYQNIALPAGEHPIGDPPSAVRGTAIPGRKPK